MNAANAVEDRAVAQNGLPKKIKKFLVPVDFSPASHAALRYAAACAAESNGSVTLIAVIANESTVFEYGEIEAITMRERLAEQWRHQLKNLADETLGNTPHQEVVKIGHPVEEIVLAAETLCMDLIVISKHGKEENIHNDLGNTAKGIVRYSTCPVLVITAKKEKAASGFPGN